MKGIGHFPMCENPEVFKKYLMPVLDRLLEYARDRSLADARAMRTAVRDVVTKRTARARHERRLVRWSDRDVRPSTMSSGAASARGRRSIRSCLSRSCCSSGC